MDAVNTRYGESYDGLSQCLLNSYDSDISSNVTWLVVGHSFGWIERRFEL